MDRPFDELDLLSIHLEVEDLDDRATRGVEDGQPYSDEVISALGNVTRLGPALTLGHPDVDLVLERRRTAREEPVVAAEDEAHRKLGQVVINDPDANGPMSRAMEGRLSELLDEIVVRELRKAKHKNLIWLLGSIGAAYAAGMTQEVLGWHLTNAFGPEISHFISTNWALLQSVAATYGASVAAWFGGAVGVLMIGRGVNQIIKGKDGDAP